MSTAPQVLTELNLSAEMQAAINNAFGTGKPIAIAYVDETGAPQLSYRGSAQALGATELAIWVRKPDGRILPSIAKNPAVALIYGDFNPENRRFMILNGRARIDASEPMRKRVFEAAHPFEQSQDPERKGSAVVIALTSVDGFFGGARLAMRARPPA